MASNWHPKWHPKWHPIGIQISSKWHPIPIGIQIYYTSNMSNMKVDGNWPPLSEHEKVNNIACNSSTYDAANIRIHATSSTARSLYLFQLLLDHCSGSSSLMQGPSDLLVAHMDQSAKSLRSHSLDQLSLDKGTGKIWVLLGDSNPQPHISSEKICQSWIPHDLPTKMSDRFGLNIFQHLSILESPPSSLQAHLCPSSVQFLVLCAGIGGGFLVDQLEMEISLLVLALGSYCGHMMNELSKSCSR